MDYPIIAMMYDFDRTLSVEDMQNFVFIPSLGMTPGEFWSKANEFAAKNRMDGILAYMYTMINESKEKNKHITRDSLVKMGNGIRFFPGVTDWFKRINEYGLSQGVQVEHYVISSGLREIVEGCSINNEFKEIFASEFLYNDQKEPIWPKAAVNYTNKTQFIYRINKGILDISNDKDLNSSMPDDNKRVRFSNMMYLGDGLSDVPCMKMVKAYGGKSIAVYQDENNTKKVEELLLKDRVDYIYPADYRENSPLEVTVKNIIRAMSINNTLSLESHVLRETVRNKL